MINLKEKTAVVTGASRGIGLEIARVLASRGANIAMIATKENKELASSMEAEFNVKVVSYACDVSSSEIVESTFKSIIESFGAIDILVNNAGITRDGLLMRMKDEDFDDVLRINLRSVFVCTKAVARHMMGRRQGRIINMASINGIRTQAGQANYAASKAGMIGFTKSIALELGSRNIRCNAIAPGFIETEMTAKLNEDVVKGWREAIPLKRGGTPEDVANVCVFLASEMSAYVTGQVINVDGGMLT